RQGLSGRSRLALGETAAGAVRPTQRMASQAVAPTLIIVRPKITQKTARGFIAASRVWLGQTCNDNEEMDMSFRDLRQLSTPPQFARFEPDQPRDFGRIPGAAAGWRPGGWLVPSARDGGRPACLPAPRWHRPVP